MHGIGDSLPDTHGSARMEMPESMEMGTSASGDKANDAAGSDDADGGGGGGGGNNGRAFVETCASPSDDMGGGGGGAGNTISMEPCCC